MKIKGQTSSRSAAETDREPWELCTAQEEIGLTVFYLAERLCYRAAFLLSADCNGRLLAAGDYWRARRKRLAHVRHGLREEVDDAPENCAKTQERFGQRGREERA